MSAARHRGFILPVVLIVVGLLALTMAGFVFFVRAEVAGARAERDAQQARLAAESGLQEVITILREARDDASVWFDNPGLFRHKLVWAETYDRENDPVLEMGSRKEMLDSGVIVPAWRYSVVAPDLTENRLEEGLFRYGLTPEAGKLNLNAASEDEITRLLSDVLIGLNLENWEELAAALLDWLDADDETRPLGAENDYYTVLEPGYYAKNGPLDTVEELLLVKGFSAAVLYGEDTNRNGILDANEDDGDESFPYYDDGDGILDHGLAPYVTVWSRESATPPDTGAGAEDEGGAEEGVADGSDEEVEEGVDEGLADGEEESFTQGEDAGPGADAASAAARINVNTAPARVLRALAGMTAEGAEQIVALRREQDAEALKSTDWLLTSGALDAETYAAVKDRLTTQALQFHVEVVGYADHCKVARRDEWVLEMRGPMAQVLYHRDLTALGFAWPVDDDTLVVERK